MKITKKEFNEVWDLYKLKYNIEVVFRFSFLELENWIKENIKNPILKEKYEMKLITPGSLISEGIMEELCGIPKEKIIYIMENLRELMDKYK